MMVDVDVVVLVGLGVVGGNDVSLKEVGSFVGSKVGFAVGSIDGSLLG